MSDEVKKTEETAQKNTEAEIEKQNKKSDIDEIKEFNKEVLGKLDSPLVVHNKDDASYEESTNVYEMNETHSDEERPTLARHRFKKEKKSKAGLIVFIFFVFILAGVVAALYITGNLPVGSNKNVTEPTTVAQVTAEPTTTIEDNYKGTIVIKGVHIFVDGYEVKGIEGLQDELAYVTPSPTAYEIIDEHANSDFLNGNVLLILEDMGFFDKTTKVTHVEKTGLMAKSETTTAAPSTTAAPKAETKKTTAKATTAAKTTTAQKTTKKQ